jgi:heat shock protein HspQ
VVIISAKMLKNPIVSTLFKSLLRWTRRPEVTGSRFALNANRFGIAKLLPHNVTVKNAEGVQAAVFHCFKTLPYTQDNINLGFSVLRELNATSAGLLDLTTARAARLKPENQAQAKFRIGQVVQHVDTNIRLVVTGWSIDETKACQLVEGIPDLLDTNEFAGFNNLNAVVKMYASELKLVDDKDLHRIINRSIQVFFEGYDSSRRRYTPSEEMRYWYAEDLVVLDRHAEMSQTAAAPVPAAELKRLNSALHTVQGTIQSMGATMQAMVKAHQSRLDELALASPEMKTKMHDIIEEVERCIAGCIDLPPAMGKDDLPYRYGDGVTHAAPVQGPIFAQTLRRGGPHRHAVMTSASGTSGDAKEAEAHSSFGSKLIRMNAAEVKKVYTAVGYLGNLYSAVDQLLQLRFQAKGIAFHDGLHVLPAPISTGISASTNDAVTSRIAATPSLDARVEKWNAETTQPEATFQVGQVVRHRKFGYRGVIRGYDMRPSLDMSQWEGIVGLAQGQEQPIYRVRQHPSHCCHTYLFQYSNIFSLFLLIILLLIIFCSMAGDSRRARRAGDDGPARVPRRVHGGPGQPGAGHRPRGQAGRAPGAS